MPEPLYVAFYETRKDEWSYASTSAEGARRGLLAMARKAVKVGAMRETDLDHLKASGPLWVQTMRPGGYVNQERAGHAVEPDPQPEDTTADRQIALHQEIARLQQIAEWIQKEDRRALEAIQREVERAESKRWRLR